MIWIKPEHPKHLTPIFRNLTEVYIFGIFPECDLSWTLFILEAAPALQKFNLSRARVCTKTLDDGAEKTNVVWGLPKDFKHFNLKWLLIQGFEDDGKVMNYIRLVMERAVRLERIVLDELPFKNCRDFERKSQMDEASRRRVKERLAHGSCSSVEIIIR
ncbi:hypothetical protein ACQJBY_047204 [Aegilops geniculata]